MAKRIAEGVCRLACSVLSGQECMQLWIAKAQIKEVHERVHTEQLAGMVRSQRDDVEYVIVVELVRRRRRWWW